MPFPHIPSELQNMSSQVAQEAYTRMPAAEHALQESHPRVWRSRYNDMCRRVLRDHGLLPPTQESLPLRRQA
ncbi:MAG: hypothetical protein RSP_04690 [Rhodanobacter sp.]